MGGFRDFGFRACWAQGLGVGVRVPITECLLLSGASWELRFKVWI